MAILKKTGKFLDPKGNRIELSKKVVSVYDEEVREVWINAGGSFDTFPMTLLGTQQAFKLPNADRSLLLDEGYRLWKYDALGGTIVSLTTYFVLGRGITFTFDDENAQFHVNKFYIKNKLEMRLRSASDESVAFGEIFMWLRPKFETVTNNGKVIWRPGDTQITFIDPKNITNIETADEDVSDVRNYIYEYEDGFREPHVVTIPDITKYSIDGFEKEIGCMVHIKLNSGNMDPFGHSDLIRIKEWLDNYQEYLRDGVIINKLYRSPCFDISIEDGSPDEVNAAIARYRSWTIGSNPVHNSREKWQILEFTGPNTSSETSRRSLLLIIAAGVGFAEYMLADGSNSNLASSKSQQLPVIKKFEDRQDIFTHFLMKVFQFALFAKSKIATNSGLQIETDMEGDPVPFRGQIKFPTIAEDQDSEIARTNAEAIDKRYMSNRTAAARLNLDYAREVEIMLQDKELIDKLENAGLIIDPTNEAIKIEKAKSQMNNTPEPNNQNSSNVELNTQ